MQRAPLNTHDGLITLQASALWDRIGYGEVAIDFNHKTVPGHPSYKATNSTTD